MNRLKYAIRNVELDSLSDAIVRAYKADTAAQADEFLKTSLSELETLSAKITTALFQDKVISTLEEADKARDEAVKTLGTVLSAYAVFPIAEKKELASPLKAVFDKYAEAGITRESYAGESSLVESMLEDFSAPSFAKNISALEGVTESINAIRSAQDNFTKANDEYVKNQAHKKACASSFNRPIVSLINGRLVPYLNAMLIAENENCISFAQKVEAEIKRANDIISRRNKKSKTEAARKADA